jgi:hypothetical protein
MINIISWSTRQTYGGLSSFKLMHELQGKCLQHFTNAQKVIHKDNNMDLEFCNFGSKFLQICVTNWTTRL